MSIADYQDRMVGTGLGPVHRNQQLPRLSTHSSTGSSGSRRGSARISKPDTPNGSPHNVQRRRSAAAHTSRAGPRPAYDSVYQARDQRLRWYHGSRHSMPVARPVSWQPTSESLSVDRQHRPSNDPAIGTTIEGMENLAVTTTPQNSVQQSIQDAFSLAYGSSVSAPPLEGDPSQFFWNDTQSAHLGYANISQQYSFDYMPYSMDQGTALEYGAGQGMFDDSFYHTLQPNNMATGADAALGSLGGYVANDQPLHSALAYPHIPVTNPRPVLDRKESNELVGIGLYQDKEPAYLSSLNADVNRHSIGKELKLEETWTPPTKPLDGEEEEENSSVDGEEVEDVPAYMDSADASSSQPTLFPNLTDLSNQSFFFTDDEQYNTEDQYANYLALGQGLHGDQVKVPSAPPGPANFMLL